jgi:hypothetical protein
MREPDAIDLLLAMRDISRTIAGHSEPSSWLYGSDRSGTIRMAVTDA